MQLVGRDDERELLGKLLKRNESSFAAMYGRRRIGKTYLIKTFYKKHIVFEASGLHEKDKQQQLENFSLSLFEVEKKIRTQPPTWLKAFQQLKEYILSLNTTQKKVIFLDEIAWFETPKSGFLAALDNFWNRFCNNRKDIILVICGSAASWIINKVINDTGGLHNRVTHQILLQPFTIKETKAFLKAKKVTLVHADILKLYMTIGGIPFYLNYIEKGTSVDAYINKLFFGKKPILPNEFKNLYASLFQHSEIHVAIVQALATKNKGLTRNEILEASKLNTGGGFTKALQELLLCDFVREITPIENKKTDALYRLVDEFTIFYYKFLANTKNTQNWQQFATTQAYSIWQGFSFENFVLKHLHIIKKQLGIQGIVTTDYSWLKKGNKTNKGAQIDMVIDRADNCINIIEAKFYKGNFTLTKPAADNLENKKQIFRETTATKKNIFTTLVTLHGAAQNAYFLQSVTNHIRFDDAGIWL
jgi:uncharacterized protein